jgi:hypothetical protein
MEESSIAHPVQLSVCPFQTPNSLLAQLIMVVEPFGQIQEGQLRFLIPISLSAQLLLQLER